MADGTMFSFRQFHIRQYFAYYKEENPEKCLLFNFNNEGAQASERTQAIEGIQAPEDIQASEDTEPFETSEAKRRRKGKAVVEYEDPADIEPEDPRGNETGVDIDKVIELKTAMHYETISNSETATDSEPEVSKGNETGGETDKEIVLMDLDSDHESDDKSWDWLRKRKANKKQMALQAKKLRFDDADAFNCEFSGLHAELLNDFDKALNLGDEEMSGGRRKGFESGSRPGCCRPSGSGFVMDRTGGAKDQEALKTQVPRRLVMTKPLSRILEGLKSEFANKNLVKSRHMSDRIEAGKCIGSGVCGGVDECEPSGSETMVAQAGDACVGLALAQGKPLDHEVLNCMLNMNPSEFCTESARNFRRII
uniref:uncharacterized protein LOC122606595 isoform X2 n=1 Tax=Erigeron canadensis TaxID=72917 RepID=UPI001CB96C3A|nr:uncharacterized protein LOC122606595 isoform X2 [Erigeron canadensis]